MTQPKQHVHSALILEKARQDATGETAAGWWKWEIDHGTDNWNHIPEPTFNEISAYRYSMTAQHPQYVPAKPIVRLIDMLRLPRGAHVTNEMFECEVLGKSSPATLRLLRVVPVGGEIAVSSDTGYLRITEQKEFTYWGGGECPLPQGLICEVIRRDGTKDITASGPVDGFWCHCRNDLDIIAYRILGVARGWTDNPNEAMYGK